MHSPLTYISLGYSHSPTELGGTGVSLDATIIIIRSRTPKIMAAAIFLYMVQKDLWPNTSLTFLREILISLFLALGSLFFIRPRSWMIYLRPSSISPSTEVDYKEAMMSATFSYLPVALVSWISFLTSSKFKWEPMPLKLLFLSLLSWMCYIAVKISASCTEPMLPRFSKLSSLSSSLLDEELLAL